MNKREFNQYCAEVMGREHPRGNPWDDLNDMIEVAEELSPNGIGHTFIDMCFSGYDLTTFKQAFRDFIISTNED